MGRSTDLGLASGADILTATPNALQTKTEAARSRPDFAHVIVANKKEEKPARAAARGGCWIDAGPANRLLVPFFNRDRADPDEFMVVMVSLPISSFTVPVAVMLMMPVLIIPAVIPMVFIGRGR
jgi:hypothetical protein